jgi:hypothetical protein
VQAAFEERDHACGQHQHEHDHGEHTSLAHSTGSRRGTAMNLTGSSRWKVRAIGVSNFMVEHLTALLEHAQVVPAVNQIELHRSAG